MSDCLYLATRKGLFRVVRKGKKDWRIATVSFLGDPVSMVLPERREGWVYAALSLGHYGVKLHRSEDQGEHWTECSAPSFPKLPGQPSGDLAGQPGPAVRHVWTLESVGEDQPGALWAGTIPGGLFHSLDGGQSWELNGSLWNRPEREQWFGGGYGQPGIHSICVDPRDSDHVSLAVSCGGVWLTRDGGRSWECRTQGMWADYMPPQLRREGWVQDPHRLVQCAGAPDCFWAQHHNGVFRSTDALVSWQQVPGVSPSVFGFTVAVHPGDPETAWFVPSVKDECRVPVDARVVVSRTRDGGKTFEVLRQGLPQQDAYDIVFRHGLEVDESGRFLAMGSTTGSLWISEDGGECWEHTAGHLPPINAVRWG